MQSLFSYHHLILHKHFQSSFSGTQVMYQNLSDWIEYIMPSPEIIVPLTYYLYPQARWSVNSRNVLYPPHPRNWLFTHYFLTTLFFKILLSTQCAHPSWFSAEIILTPKVVWPIPFKQLPSNLSHFSFTQTFSQNLAKCLEKFLLNSNIIGLSLHKGFLTGISGRVKHIFSITSILDSAT